MEELVLIKQCLRKHSGAQKRLYDLYYPAAYRLTRRYLANKLDAEDVLINVFIRVFRNIDDFEFRGTGSLQKWINTITINECIRFLSRYKPIISEEEISNLVIEKDWNGESSDCDTEEIMHIMKSMPEGYRMVFNLFALEGYPHAEIAVMLNITEGTSKSQLSKARNYIIEKLNKKKSYGTK